MKSTVALIALGLAASASAQSACASVAAQVPGCATQCIASAASGVGCTDPTDFACQCKNTGAINSAALNCVLKGCGAQTGLAVQASASAVCACVATAAAASSAPASATSMAVMSASSSAAMSISSAVSSAQSAVASSSVSAPSSSAAVAVSQATDGQVQASGTAKPTVLAPSNSTMAFTGAGARVVASIGGLLVAVGAAAVAL